MHISTHNSPYANLKTLSLQNVSIQGGFWSRRQAMNRQQSLKHAFRKLEESGNFNNLKLAMGSGEGEYRRPVFMDSDIYKWLEAVSYELANRPNPKLEEMAEHAIQLLTSAQQGDGYLNSFYQVVEPDNKWTELAMGHELYCAGHLFEAAVAHHRGTGKTSLLEIACRFADHIDATFGPGKRDGVPGHPEIELALVELYRDSGERRYLDLAGFFIDQRGQGKMIGKTWFAGGYHQDRVPVREATVIEGHAVRQLYLTAGIADVYLESGEAALLEVSERLWQDMVAHKMHLTAGLGARHSGESFGEAYELPSDQCYCETCASIANMMWNWRMLLISGESRFADLLERSLYNGFLSGISLDGQRYFYVNPLLSRGGIERPEWYGCACCPPNVMRQIAMLGHYVATTNGDGLQIHQYITSQIETELAGVGALKLRVDTDYPWDGKVSLLVEECDGSSWELAVRIPGWCLDASLKVNGQAIREETLPGSYARVKRAWQAGDSLQLDLALTPRLTEPNPRIDATRGCLAIERGPLVYCLEEIDQPAGADLLDVTIDSQAQLQDAWRADLLDGVVVVEASGGVQDQRFWEGRLYRPLSSAQDQEQPVNLTAVPYFSWANRDTGKMRVWIPEK